MGLTGCRLRREVTELGIEQALALAEGFVAVASRVEKCLPLPRGMVLDRLGEDVAGAVGIDGGGSHDGDLLPTCAVDAQTSSRTVTIGMCVFRAAFVSEMGRIRAPPRQVVDFAAVRDFGTYRSTAICQCDAAMKKRPGFSENSWSQRRTSFRSTSAKGLLSTWTRI